jgi:hypothetical protein
MIVILPLHHVRLALRRRVMASADTPTPQLSLNGPWPWQGNALPFGTPSESAIIDAQARFNSVELRIGTMTAQEDVARAI